jgi:hypothetical protein
MRSCTAELEKQAAEINGQISWFDLLQQGKLRCASTFRDASNRWWRRDFEGILSRNEDRKGAEECIRSAYELRYSSNITNSLQSEYDRRSPWRSNK